MLLSCLGFLPPVQRAVVLIERVLPLLRTRASALSHEAAACHHLPSYLRRYHPPHFFLPIATFYTTLFTTALNTSTFPQPLSILPSSPLRFPKFDLPSATLYSSLQFPKFEPLPSTTTLTASNPHGTTIQAINLPGERDGYSNLAHRHFAALVVEENAVVFVNASLPVARQGGHQAFASDPEQRRVLRQLHPKPHAILLHL